MKTEGKPFGARGGEETKADSEEQERRMPRVRGEARDGVYGSGLREVYGLTGDL